MAGTNFYFLGKRGAAVPPNPEGLGFRAVKRMKKLTIHGTSLYNASQLHSHSAISVQELKSWIHSGKILFHLFRYREVEIITYDLKLMSKPFLFSLLAWCLGWGVVSKRDLRGNVEKITLFSLILMSKGLLYSFFKKSALLKRVEGDVNELYAKLADRPAPVFCSRRRPLYLRTDFHFGLKAGGSVGHIAGVLNHLDHFLEKPIFVTSDRIPTVRSDIETHLIYPESDCWDFGGLLPLDYSYVFFKRAMQILKEKRPAFIYQRYSLSQFGGVFLAQQLQVPFVLEFNGSEVWVNRNWGNPLKYGALAEKIEMLNLRAADLIVVVSKPLQTILIAQGIDEAKILINPNGVDPEKYHPNLDGSKVRLHYKLQDRLVIGFIGTFGAWHGAEVLAESFCELLYQFPEYRDRLRLLMVGNGTRIPLVQQVIAQWKMSDACVFTDTVPQEEGPEYLAACDILVSPQIPNVDGSPFFGSPTKVFEYMAMGKGIVASDLDQIGEVLEHNRTAILVRPGNTESLMQGLKNLVDHPELRKKLGEEARKEVFSKYSWKEHTRKIVDRIRFL